MHDWQVNQRAHLCYASEQGLCPKNKNHPILGWMIIFWASNDAYIDLSEYIGESFKIESAEADMELSSIMLPEGWKFYDGNDVELTATKQWEIIVAKTEISSGDIE